MNSIYNLLILIVLFNIINLLNCKNTSEYFIVECKINKIIILSDSALNERLKVQQKVLIAKSKLDFRLKNKFSFKSHFKLTIEPVETNSKETVGQDISRLISMGIRKTIKLIDYNEESSPIYSYYEEIPKFVDLRLGVKNVTFRAFLPDNFLNLRILYNIAQEFNESFNYSTLIENEYIENSKFFYTSDNKYIVQIIKKKQFKLLSLMVFDYFSHFCTFPNTSLPKYAGLYYLKHNSMKYYIVVFKKLYPYHFNLSLYKQYFLNGSDRTAFKDEEVNLDNNFTSDYQNGLKIPSHVQTGLIKSLENDTKLLANLKIINYSLVLIIHTLDNEVDLVTRNAANIFNSNQHNEPIVVTNNGKQTFIYYGIIYNLQTCNYTKTFKNLCGCLLREIVQNPNEYQKRFMNFVTSKVFK